MHVIRSPVISTKQRLGGEVTQTQDAECSASSIREVSPAMTSSLSGYATSTFGKRSVDFIFYFPEQDKNRPGV